MQLVSGNDGQDAIGLRWLPVLPLSPLVRSSSDGDSKFNYRIFTSSFSSDDATLASPGEWNGAFLDIGKS